MSPESRKCGSIRHALARALSGVVASAVLVAGVAVASAPTASARTNGIVQADGCISESLVPTDDSGSRLAGLPFTLNFFGREYDELWVNNNGNITFEAPQSIYTPYTIDANIPPMIAPFFADVDTRGTGEVTFGAIDFGYSDNDVGGYKAFCVNWSGVGYYPSRTDKTNTFQLILVSRPDRGVGAIDIIFNYDELSWEAGDASSGTGGLGGTSAGAGYSAGDGDAAHYYEIPGSRIPGSFIDTNPNGLTHTSTGLSTGSSTGTTSLGRHLFKVRASGPTADVPEGLFREYPATKLGYAFANRGLSGWREETGLSQADVIRADDMSRVFSDFNTYKNRGAWFVKWHDEGSLLDAFAGSMNGGMCYGMALSGGRFDSGHTPLFSGGLGRSATSWSVPSTAYGLPTPSSVSTRIDYSKEMLRLLSTTFISQLSVEALESRAAQIDAFSDPVAGAAALRKQLVSIMQTGKDLYDTSGKLDAPAGTRNALLLFFADIGTEDVWGHAVNIYSMKQESDGTLVLGVWDNNYPGQSREMKVMPNGTWTYDGGYQVASKGALLSDLTLSLRNDNSDLARTQISLFPLYDAANLKIHSAAASNQGANTSATGLVVDVPAGTEVEATDALGLEVTHNPVAAGPGVDGGSTTLVPSGTGRITITGDSVVMRRADALSGVDLADGTRTATVSTTANTGTVSVESGKARLMVTRSNLMAIADGSQSLTVTATGDIAVTSSGAQTRLTVHGEVNGRDVAATLLDARGPAGTVYRYTKSTVDAQLRAVVATPSKPAVKMPKKKQKVSIKSRTKRAVKGKKVTVKGKVNTKGKKVALQVRKNGKWRTIARVKVSRTGKFKFSTKKLQVGKKTLRVRRPTVPGYKRATSRTFKVKIAKRR